MPRRVDTVANAGSRVWQDHLHNGTAVQMDAWILLIESMCNNQGWTTTASTTTSGHPDRTLLSKQSPYYDDLAMPPASYVGKVKMRVWATSNTDIRFRFSNESGSVASASDTTISDRPRYHRINVNPYQFSMRVIDAALGQGIIVSAPHTPPWLQKAGLKEFIYAVNHRYARGLYDAGGIGLIHIDAPGVITQTLATGLAVSNAPRLKAIRGYATGTLRVANAIDDLTLTNSLKWHPFFWPAAIGLPINFNDINGVLHCGYHWDMIVSSLDPSVGGSGLLRVIRFDNGQEYENMTEDNGAAATSAGCLWRRRA